MEIERRAVIDVGTNSVKLLVAEVDGHCVTALFEKSRQTRLGEGLYAAGELQPDRIEAVALASAEFAVLARQQNAKSLRVIATSATRDANNKHVLLDALHRATGARAEVISGAEEAALAFRGVCTDSRYSQRALWVMEVGGGSTQLSHGSEGEMRFSTSMPLGTVRLLQMFPHSDPPTESEWIACNAHLRGELEKHQADFGSSGSSAASRSTGHPPFLVGTGGTASILGCMAEMLPEFDRDKLENAVLSREDVARHERQLWSATLEQRKLFAGLPPNRADIILYGVSVVRAVMELSGAAEFRVSTRGLRFGALMG